MKTGMTVTHDRHTLSCTEITEVFFRELSQKEIMRYVESGEPMDKAGAYGIQGKAGLFVTGIVGDYFTIVGLPVCRVGSILRKHFGFTLI